MGGKKKKTFDVLVILEKLFPDCTEAVLTSYFIISNLQPHFRPVTMCLTVGRES